MAGAYRMALSGATVVVTPLDGEPVSHARVSVSVRDGVARVRGPGAQTLAEMPAADLTGRGRNWRITGTDGTVWAVSKPCNCRGSI